MTTDNIMDLVTTNTDLSTEVLAEDVSALVSSGDWLPRIVICGSSTDLVKEGKIAQGVFALVRSATDFKDLGKQIDFLSFTFRAKGMRLKNTPSGKPMSFYDRKSDEFKKIQLDSQGKDSGCVWGPEFLIWLPVANSFATFFCGNPTMRRAAPDLYAVMRDPSSPDDRPVFKPTAASATMKFIKTTAQSWWGATFSPHTTPLPNPEVEDFATMVTDQMTKFKNPPKSTVEVETAAAAESGRAR